MIELVLAAATLAAPVQLSTRIADGVLEVRGPRAAWQDREIHKTAERNVIFVPAASVTKTDRTIKGVTLQSYDAKRGAVIVVKPGSAKLAEHLRFTPASVRPEPAAKRPSRRAALESTTPPVRPEPAAKRPSRRNVLPASVLKDMNPRVRKGRKAKQAKAPFDTTASQSAQDEPVGAETESALAGSGPSDEPVEVTESAMTGTGLDRLRGGDDSSWIRMLGISLLLAVLGVFALWLKRGRKVPDLDGGSIEIISVKALGPKHRLAIVEAAGERLLISTSDNEVRLLSSLGYATPAYAAANTEEPPAPAPVTPSEDVAGLMRLRDETGIAADFDAVLKSVNNTQYVA